MSEKTKRNGKSSSTIVIGGALTLVQFLLWPSTITASSLPHTSILTSVHSPHLVQHHTHPNKAPSPPHFILPHLPLTLTRPFLDSHPPCHPSSPYTLHLSLHYLPRKSLPERLDKKKNWTHVCFSTCVPQNIVLNTDNIYIN